MYLNVYVILGTASMVSSVLWCWWMLVSKVKARWRLVLAILSDLHRGIATFRVEEQKIFEVILPDLLNNRMLLLGCLSAWLMLKEGRRFETRSRVQFLFTSCNKLHQQWICRYTNSSVSRSSRNLVQFMTVTLMKRECNYFVHFAF
jgi:hypothetical protein